MGCRFFYASITTRLGAEMRQNVTVKSKISNKNIRLLSSSGGYQVLSCRCEL